MRNGPSLTGAQSRWRRGCSPAFSGTREGAAAAASTRDSDRRDVGQRGPGRDEAPRQHTGTQRLPWRLSGGGPPLPGAGAAAARPGVVDSTWLGRRRPKLWRRPAPGPEPLLRLRLSDNISFELSLSESRLDDIFNRKIYHDTWDRWRYL